MKNYLVFMYPDFEASGGMHDCIGSAETLEDAKVVILQYLNDSYGEHEPHGLLLNREAHIYSISDERVVLKTFIGPYPEWGWKDPNETT